MSEDYSQMPFRHMPSNSQHTLVKLAFLHNGQKKINLQLNKNDIELPVKLVTLSPISVYCFRKWILNFTVEKTKAIRVLGLMNCKELLRHSTSPSNSRTGQQTQDRLLHTPLGNVYKAHPAPTGVPPTPQLRPTGSLPALAAVLTPIRKRGPTDPSVRTALLQLHRQTWHKHEILKNPWSWVKINVLTYF